MKTYRTNYSVAVHWLNNSYILCNSIVDVDDSVLCNMPMETDEDGNYIEVYQWFLSNCSESDVEFLTEHFPNIKFSYSEMLGLYILCVTHYGTSWDYVYCETDLENAEAPFGKRREDL